MMDVVLLFTTLFLVTSTVSGIGVLLYACIEGYKLYRRIKQNTVVPSSLN